MPRQRQLLRVIEIAEYLGVSKQRAHQLAAERGFPKPARRPRSGRLWEPRVIERWAVENWWDSKPWRI
jgi:predicted DNA-binding transcriptional regulator AlpA